MSAPTPPTRRINIPAQHEFRFELEGTEALQVTLLNGTAEVFGMELVVGLPHPFGDEARASIWSGDGCDIEMSPVPSSSTRFAVEECMMEQSHGRDAGEGLTEADPPKVAMQCNVETSYVASESHIPSYLSLHLALSRLRLLARPSSLVDNAADLSLRDDEVPPPRIMVVGERGAGKTSLIKSLINWRVREAIGTGSKAAGKKGAVFVNLDVGEGGLTMPGTLSLCSTKSVLPTTTPIAVLGTSISGGPPVPFPAPSSATTWTPPSSIDAYAPPVNPLVFWHGHTSPNINPVLFEFLLKRVAKSLKRKMEEGDTETWKAGAIVDTPGEWAEKKGMAVVAKAVRELEINVLLVMGNERLTVDMKKLLATNKTVTVVRVPKNDGASEPDLSYQTRVKEGQIRSYFYGGPSLTQGLLSPFSIIVKFEDLKIFRVGEAADVQAPSSALPIGASRAVADTELLAIDLTLPRTPSELLHRILAIPQADDDSGDEEIVGSPVMGFVYISAMDQTKKKVTMLSPLPGRLPRRTLLLASLDWHDT